MRESGGGGGGGGGQVFFHVDSDVLSLDWAVSLMG